MKLKLSKLLILLVLTILTVTSKAQDVSNWSIQYYTNDGDVSKSNQTFTTSVQYGTFTNHILKTNRKLSVSIIIDRGTITMSFLQYGKYDASMSSELHYMTVFDAYGTPHKLYCHQNKNYIFISDVYYDIFMNVLKTNMTTKCVFVEKGRNMSRYDFTVETRNLFKI